MANVKFSHPELSDLIIAVNPNSIRWSYGLNTVSYPTYGGEVVQILSCYIDDMTIEGEVRTYKEAETIYGWFISYMQIATQGNSSVGSVNRFDTRPVTFTYLERDWTFTIYPKSLVKFAYGRDVVVPSWTVEAAVSEHDDDYSQTLIDSKLQEMMESGGVEFFGTATANIGYKENNPFSGVLEPGQEKSDELADSFNKLIPSYMQSDFSDLQANYSKPVIIAGKGNSAPEDRQDDPANPVGVGIEQAAKRP